MIQAVFFDIDGTLITLGTRVFPASAVSALTELKEKGVRLFIASGRPPVQLKLMPEVFHTIPWDGYVMMNGQYCMEGDKTVFHTLSVARKTLEVLVPWLREQSFVCVFNEFGYSYSTRFNPDHYAYLKSIGKEKEMLDVKDCTRALSHTTYQINAYIPPEQDAEFLRHAPGMKSARWTDRFADMIPAEGGKTVGIQKTLDHFGIPLSACMAFGDGGNDIGMLEYVPLGIAMGNAEEKVKKAADYVTDAVDRDGVYKALKHFGVLD